jgi:hypothetical protein
VAQGGGPEFKPSTAKKIGKRRDIVEMRILNLVPKGMGGF